MKSKNLNFFKVFKCLEKEKQKKIVEMYGGTKCLVPRRDFSFSKRVGKIQKEKWEKISEMLRDNQKRNIVMQYYKRVVYIPTFSNFEKRKKEFEKNLKTESLLSYVYRNL